MRPLSQPTPARGLFALVATALLAFALGGWLLTRMASIDLPERFTARAVVPGGES